METLYAQRKRENRTSSSAQPEQASSARAAALAAAAKTDAASPGRRIDLPEAMRAKMEHAFHADFSALRLYESQQVADAGAEAVTQGAKIAFAPGVFHLSSRRGQALLGHELSHVVSQSRGEARGRGFLNDPALEAKADREGAMAAAGQQIAMPTAPLSSASAAPAAGPMQAHKGPKNNAVITDYNKLAEEEKKKNKSNDAFEGAFKQISDKSSKVSDLAEKFADPDAVRKSVDKKIDLVGEVFHTDTKIPKLITKGLAGEVSHHTDADAAAKTANIATLTGSSASVPTAVMNLGDSFDKLEKAKKSGSKAELANARFGVASSELSAAKTGTSFAKNVASQFDTDAAKTTVDVTKDLGKGIGFASQGVGLLRDIYNVGESTQRKNSMNRSAEALEEQRRNTVGPLTENDQENIATFRQGGKTGALDQKRAAFSLVSRAIGIGSSATSAAAVPVASTALDLTQKAWDAVTGEVMNYETDKFHKDTVEDKLHTAQDFEEFQGEDKMRAFHGVNSEAYRKALLRSQGYKSGSTDEAFEGITKARAKRLTTAAAKKEGWAREYAGNAGIDADRLEGADDETKEAIQNSFLKSLGGNKDAEFHSNNVMEYDAFKKQAIDYHLGKDPTDPKSDPFEVKQTRGFWGDVGHKLKGVGLRTWASVKSGGKKALSAVKGIAKGTKNLTIGAVKGVNKLLTSSDPWVKAGKAIQTGASKAVGAVKRGAKTAASNIKDFALHRETRKKALAALKTGAANAVKATGRGIVKGGKYAWNVGKHSVTSRVRKLKDWYHEGVDQMNMHKDSYKHMSLLDRMAWSAKNLPARMLHGIARNKIGTANRFYDSLRADEAVATMNRIRAGEPPPSQQDAQPSQAAAQEPPQAAGSEPSLGKGSAFDSISQMYQSDSEKSVLDGEHQKYESKKKALEEWHDQAMQNPLDAKPKDAKPQDASSGDGDNSLLKKLNAQLAELYGLPIE